jgi:hypothetical protein
MVKLAHRRVVRGGFRAHVVERPAHVAVEVNLDRAGEDHSAMNFRIALKADAASVNFAQQVWQLCDIGRNAPRLSQR